MQQLELHITTMETVHLPQVMRLTRQHLLTWTPAPVIEPNEALLKAMRSGRRSVRAGKQQTVMSQRRQNFITGLSVHRMGADERMARAAYEEEWHWRLGHD